MNEETTMILIDTALASGSASALDPEERGLQELVLAVRDDAPVPDPDFALRLNARVAAGFPARRGGIRAWVVGLFESPPPMLTMGAAATLLVGLMVAVVALNGGGSQHSSSSPSITGGQASSRSGNTASGSGSVAAGTTPERAAAPSLQAAPIAPSPGGFVGGHNRKVERNAELVLGVPQDKMSETGDKVIAVTDRYRGYVLRSSVTTAGANDSGGSFDLRVPVRNLQPALRDLSALADVVSRTENSDDVTAAFVSRRTQLDELNAERRGLLRRLAHATTDQESAAIRARIGIVNAQIDSQTQALGDLSRRTSYAAVSVTLQPKQGGGGGGGGIGSGARDLRNSLIDAANLALRVLGVALPIAILIALLWAGGGWFSRRRREAVLD